MRKSFFIKLVLIAVMVVGTMSLTGCYLKRDVIDITPDQTAFAVPFSGDRDMQAQLFTEDSLRENQVSVKRYTVEYERVKTSSGQVFSWMRPQKPKVKLIVIDLKPVTRAWTAAPTTGSTAANQALIAETKESVAFSAEMNCNAAVDEANAAKFVSAYYGKSLENVMDSQIRPYAQQLFTEKCALYTLDELLLNKAAITKHVRDEATKFFAARGIMIQTLGMQGEIVYLNPAIQDSIDKRIQSQNDYLAQQAQNRKKKEMADAAMYEAERLSGPVAIRLKQLEIQKMQAQASLTQAEKWNGALPTTMYGPVQPFITAK